MAWRYDGLRAAKPQIDRAALRRVCNESRCERLELFQHLARQVALHLARIVLVLACRCKKIVWPQLHL